jgi:hypothetical protein
MDPREKEIADGLAWLALARRYTGGSATQSNRMTNPHTAATFSTTYSAHAASNARTHVPPGSLAIPPPIAQGAFGRAGINDASSARTPVDPASDSRTSIVGAPDARIPVDSAAESSVQPNSDDNLGLDDDPAEPAKHDRESPNHLSITFMLMRKYIRTSRITFPRDFLTNFAREMNLPMEHV